MHELAPLILDLAIMLGVAGVVVLLFQSIKQPVVLGYLVAGIIIGPHTLPFGLVTDVPNIKILSELGVIFLMFSLGLEFSFQKLTKVGFSAVLTGIIDVSFMVCVGYTAGKLMGWGFNDCLFLGAALAISSTTIIIKAVSELNLKTKRFAGIVFGVLIVEDLLAILLLVALSTIIMTKSVLSTDILLAAIKLVVVVGGWFLVGYFLVPTTFRRYESYFSQETLTIVSVGLCLTLVSIAAYFQYSTALGAFIMGSILAETVLVKRIEELIVPIRDIFGAVFFISVGMLINPSLIIQQWQAIVLIAGMLMMGKVFVITFGTFLTGQSLRTAVRSGFSMAQIGEFSFIIATLGSSLKVINDELYPLIVAVSAITTFTTPYMMRLSGAISDALEKNLPDRVKYFLDSYSAWAYRVQTSSSGNPLLRSVTVRVIANGIMVAIFFTIVNKVVHPELSPLFESEYHARLVSEVLAITVSSPFLWGMLFSFKTAVIPDYARSKLNPIVFLVWLATLAEVILLSTIYFHTWVTTALFVIIFTVFIAVAYRRLERSYFWFEKQLVRNIKKQPTQRPSRYRELAPWDTHFVELEVGDGSPFIGRMLSQSQFRQRFGINIVAIHRGHQTLLAPRGEEKLQDGDKLILLGNDEQIDSIRNSITRTLSTTEQAERLEKFELKPILLNEAHPLIGQSIRESGIRERLGGLVVGIERGNQRILNPSPDMELKRDDLLLVVGEDEKIKEYTLPCQATGESPV